MDYNKILYNTTKKAINDLGQDVGKIKTYDIYDQFVYNKKAIVKYKKQAVQSSSYLIELNDQYTFTMLEPVPINWFIVWNNGAYKVVSIDNTINGIYTMYANIEDLRENHTYTITINNTNPLECKVGDVVTINYTCTKDGETDTSPNITYSANNDNVTIKNNLVTCIKEGTTTITATYNGVSASINVNIAKADEYAIQQDNITLYNGETVQLNPICTINGVQEYNSTITYSVSESSIANVDENGLVTGVGIGNTTITLEWNGISKTINVTVNAVVVNYTITGAEIFKHMTQSIYTLSPVNNNCIWSIDQDSIDLEIARIDSQDSTSCTVYGYQTNSSEYFTLYAKDGDTVLAEKTIYIKKTV